MTYHRRRLYALMTDLLIAVIINLAILMSFSGIIQESAQYLNPLQKLKFLSTLSQWELGSFPIVFFFYTFSCYLLNEGATIGKAIFGLKISTGQGRISFLKTALRCMFHSLLVTKAFPLLGIGLLTKDGRGLHDWISQTHIRPVKKAADNVLSFKRDDYFEPDFDQDEWAA